MSIKTEYIHNENSRGNFLPSYFLRCFSAYVILIDSYFFFIDLNQPMMAHLQQRLVQLQRIKDEASGHLIAVSSSASLSQHCSTSVSQSSLILPLTTVVSRPSSATSNMPLTPVNPTMQPSTPIQSDIPVQSPVSNELQNQLPVITPPPPPPYPGPPPPYPSQLKVILILIFHSNLKCCLQRFVSNILVYQILNLPVRNNINRYRLPVKKMWLFFFKYIYKIINISLAINFDLNYSNSHVQINFIHFVI